MSPGAASGAAAPGGARPALGQNTSWCSPAGCWSPWSPARQHVHDLEQHRFSQPSTASRLLATQVSRSIEYSSGTRSNGAIAGILMVSERAVEKHVGNIFSKLGLAPSDADHRRVLAVLRYLES